MAEQLERIQIIERLIDLVSTKSTGTFSIITASTHLAVLLFKNGKIISLTYSHFRGLKALEQIEQIDSGMCSFKTTVLGVPQKDLPTTREIIHRLEIRSTRTAETTRNTLNESENLASNQQASNQQAPNQQAIDSFPEEELLSGISDILLKYIGPIAPMICEDTASDLGGVCSLSDADKLLQNLASDISDSNEQKRFISDVSQYIRKHFK